MLQFAPGYEAVDDGRFIVPGIKAGFVNEFTRRVVVEYTGPDAPGTIVVDPYARRLYYVTGPRRAYRYAVAVGRAGLAFSGTGVIQRKEEWPSWTPTANMVRTRPDLYYDYRGGLPGGLINPLGARALYLYRNGRDTYYRIHGTEEQSSIGRATSAGCIRLFNQDAMHLYNQIGIGTRVRVRSLSESLQQEGPFVDNENGYAVPADPAAAEALARANADRLEAGGSL